MIGDFMNYSRKRAAEIDKEILEKGSPSRVDGFDEMIMPLIEDMSIQMQTAAARKQISLGTNYPDKAEARESASMPTSSRSKKPKALSIAEAKKRILDKAGESSYLDVISNRQEAQPEEIAPDPVEETAVQPEESEMDFSGVTDDIDSESSDQEDDEPVDLNDEISELYSEIKKEDSDAESELDFSGFDDDEASDLPDADEDQDSESDEDDEFGLDDFDDEAFENS